MSLETDLQTARTELEAARILVKCQQCGCLQGALDQLARALPGLGADGALALAHTLALALEDMRLVQYACLGCEHCYPAVAQNAFAQAYPAFSPAELTCEMRTAAEGWPPVAGEYFVLDPAGAVAVSTLASAALARELAGRRPAGLAIVGKTETENIGLDKVIKNILASPAVRYLLLAGPDSTGHQTGRTFLALARNGVDEDGRVLGSPGRRPILRNVSPQEIQAFRQQVQVVDLIGCLDPDAIGARIAELAPTAGPACGCGECGDAPAAERAPDAAAGPACGCDECGAAPAAERAPDTAAAPEAPLKLDPAGYFVILPRAEHGLIQVEHYAYDNTLLRVLNGATARELCQALVHGGWVSELSHAAYLGRELARAELALAHGWTYVQDE